MFKSVDHNPNTRIDPGKKQHVGVTFYKGESTTPIQYNQILKKPMYHVIVIRSSYSIVGWGLQRSCAGRKWRWRYQPPSATYAPQTKQYLVIAPL